VKVQYPDAAGWVDDDLAALRSAASLFSGAFGRNGEMDVRYVADELARHLVRELDYRREAAACDRVAASVAGEPGIVVPRVVHDRSAERVITYEWIEGRSLDAALRSDDSRERERAAELLAIAFYRQLLGHGVLHADPHPGNFLWTADGRLALLDFGCVKEFEPAFHEAFVAMVRARLAGDVVAERRAMRRLGLHNEHGDAEQLDDAHRLADWFAEGLLADELDFERVDYVARTRALAAHFVSRRRLPPRQGDFLLLTRVVLGLFEYLSRARAHLPMRALALVSLEP
jgi:predicted unusual protein kinase regulating ubiquinone biosynthesis (AarF/ABC1/UbiB family)